MKRTLFAAAAVAALAAGPAFAGGVSIAVGDINNDGVDDIIVGAGPGGGPHVRVIDGSKLDPAEGQLLSFFAFPATFQGGVTVAAGDVNGDGFDDIIVGAGAGGGPHVKVFDGRDSLAAGDGAAVMSFMAYTPSFNGGVTVAAGDVNGDGRDDIITGAGPGGHVKVFDGRNGAAIGEMMADKPGANNSPKPQRLQKLKPQRSQ